METLQDQNRKTISKKTSARGDPFLDDLLELELGDLKGFASLLAIFF